MPSPEYQRGYRRRRRLAGDVVGRGCPSARVKHEKEVQRRKVDPEVRRKYLARMAVATAIDAGNLVRPDMCSVCKQVGKVQAHHEDYSRPLDVAWLCIDCHAGAHRGDM